MQNRKTVCENIYESVRRRWMFLLGIFCVFVCLALVIWVIQCNYSNSSTSRNQPTSNKTFDLLLLSLSWPISFCRSLAEKRAGGTETCVLPKNGNNWLIHGLWPNKMGYCSPSSFNETELKPIRAELEEYWLTMLENSTNADFWKHEWLKHGTCALQCEVINTQLKYFRRSLELYKQYNVTKALAECGIHPNDWKLYKNNEFVDCFKKHFNIHPQLSCKRMRNEETLQEIRLCFDENLILRDCDKYAQEYCLENFLYPSIIEPKV